MGLFDFFTRRNDNYASPWLNLTVIYAIGLDGLDSADVYAIRSRFLQAKPISFEYAAPGSFIAYFPASSPGLEAAEALAHGVRQYASERAIARFGVSVRQGECLATRTAGGFAGKPVGEVVSQAMHAAQEAAGADERAGGASG